MKNFKTAITLVLVLVTIVSTASAWCCPWCGAVDARQYSNYELGQMRQTAVALSGNLRYIRLNGRLKRLVFRAAPTRDAGKTGGAYEGEVVQIGCTVGSYTQVFNPRTGSFLGWAMTCYLKKR